MAEEHISDDEPPPSIELSRDTPDSQQNKVLDRRWGERMLFNELEENNESTKPTSENGIVNRITEYILCKTSVDEIGMKITGIDNDENSTLDFRLNDNNIANNGVIDSNNSADKRDITDDENFIQNSMSENLSLFDVDTQNNIENTIRPKSQTSLQKEISEHEDVFELILEENLASKEEKIDIDSDSETIKNEEENKVDDNGNKNNEEQKESNEEDSDEEDEEDDDYNEDKINEQFYEYYHDKNNKEATERIIKDFINDIKEEEERARKAITGIEEDEETLKRLSEQWGYFTNNHNERNANEFKVIMDWTYKSDIKSYLPIIQKHEEEEYVYDGDLI